MLVKDISQMRTTKRVDIKKTPLVVGDIHGMYKDLVKLLTTQAGFEWYKGNLVSDTYHLFSVGDLVNRGEDSLKVLNLKIDASLGNHDWRTLRVLAGRNVQVADGHNGIQDILEKASLKEKEKYFHYLSRCPLQYLVNDQFIITHGAILNDDINKQFNKALHSNVYGCPVKDGEDENNNATDWRDDYNLPYTCIYGHTRVPEVVIYKNTVNIDTGAAFGNKLTAYDPVNKRTFQIKTTRPVTNTSTEV
jgi:protein phosphatase